MTLIPRSTDCGPDGHCWEDQGRVYLPRGFQTFACYSHNDNWSYEGRGQGFEAALRKSGRTCTWLRWHETKQQVRQEIGGPRHRASSDARVLQLTLLRLRGQRTAS